MDIPRIGVGVPNFGPHASPDSIVAVAKTAEHLGFHSVWTFERLLLPAPPDGKNPYGLPEHTAAGVPLTRRGAGFEDHLAAMRACWAPNPVEYNGRHYRIPRSEIGPKPVNGHLPVLIGGTSQPAVERAARLGDGFAAVFQGWDTTRTQINWYRSAGGAGAVVLRVNPEQINAGDPAAPFTGAVPAVIDDLARAATAGVDEVIWDLNFAGLDPHRQADALEALASMLKA